MGISRSSFYDQPIAAHDDTAIVEAITTICDEFEFYGWRRVRVELRHRGMIVNHIGSECPTRLSGKSKYLSPGLPDQRAF